MKIMKIFNIILSLVLIACSFSANAKAPPPGSGKADVPANILLMLDTSGSMNTRGNQSRLFSQPTGICFDSKGNKFVIEYPKHKVLKFDTNGSLVKVFGVQLIKTIMSM